MGPASTRPSPALSPAATATSHGCRASSEAPAAPPPRANCGPLLKLRAALALASSGAGCAATAGAAWRSRRATALAPRSIAARCPPNPAGQEYRRDQGQQHWHSCPPMA